MLYSVQVAGVARVGRHQSPCAVSLLETHQIFKLTNGTTLVANFRAATSPSPPHKKLKLLQCSCREVTLTSPTQMKDEECFVEKVTMTGKYAIVKAKT